MMHCSEQRVVGNLCAIFVRTSTHLKAVIINSQTACSLEEPELKVLYDKIFLAGLD
jgi:hypothetical protein